MKHFLVFSLISLLCVGLSNSLTISSDVDEDIDILHALARPIGFLDTVNVTTATGWTCDPTQPNTTLRVIFLLDGVIFAGSTSANLPREPAVAAQCGSNSQHGFVFHFSPAITRVLSNGKSHTIAAFAIPAPFGKPVQLSNSPQTVVVNPASPSPTPSISPSRTPSVTPSPSASPGSSAPIGFLDVANFTTAAGWACDPLRPNQSLIVEIFIDGTFATATVANLTREAAVGAMCGQNSNHGFVVTFNPAVTAFLMNGQAHNISAFAVPFPAGTPVQLSNSPQTVQNPNVTLATGFLDLANTTTAAGWACSPSFPNATLTVFVVVDNFFFGGSTLALLPREDAVGAACGGDPNHGWVIEFPTAIVDILSNGQPHNVSAFVVPFPAGTPIELHDSPRVVQAGIIIKKQHTHDDEC